MAKKKSGFNGMREAKNLIGTGIMTGVGHSVVGSMGGMPGMPAGAGAPIHAGLNLVATGQMARTGMNLAGSMGGWGSSSSKKKKSKMKW